MDTLYKIVKWENARVLLLVLLLGGLTVEAVYSIKSPAIPLLPPHRDGTWIRPNWPANLVAMYGDTEIAAFYRKRIMVTEPSRDIIVDLSAFRNITLFLDRNPLPLPIPSSWKDRIHSVLPAPLLTTGSHELMLRVVNRLGPPLFHLSSNVRGLGDLEGWEFSQDGMIWIPALRCDDMMMVEIRSMFPTVWEGLRSSLRFLVPILMGMLTFAAFRPRWIARFTAPGSVKNILLVLWLIIGINNMFKLPIDIGFDPESHVEYISYLLQNHRLPTASEGMQMFQPPLYYLVSAALYWILIALVSPQAALFLLRLIPLVCALLLVDISFRILRDLFPEKEDFQSCGLVIGGLLPMNLYMCQYVGNEPLAALLTSLLLFLVIKIFRNTEPIRWKDAVLLGGVAGLAILTKVTPVLLVMVICLVFLFIPREEPIGIGSRAKLAGLFLLTAGIVSGWFYVRNWMIFGKPFLGGWDPARNIFWWQDPGYRTVGDFITFGETFRQPIYAAFNGFADGVYSTFWSDGYLSGMAFYSAKPGWNYDLLAAGIVLSLVPASAMGVGIAVAFWRTVKRENWPHTFLLMAIIVYFAALLHLYVSLPIYSTAKATYLMGLTPGFSVMAATGAGLFVRRKYIGPVFVSLLGTWGIMTYLGYFVR